MPGDVLHIIGNQIRPFTWYRNIPVLQFLGLEALGQSDHLIIQMVITGEPFDISFSPSVGQLLRQSVSCLNTSGGPLQRQFLFS